MFEIIGGRTARTGLLFRSNLVPTAPTSVANDPNITSGNGAPHKILEKKQPIVSPGTAAAVKTGRIVRDSDILTWISIKDNGAKTIVNATYDAAINAPCTNKIVDGL